MPLQEGCLGTIYGSMLYSYVQFLVFMTCPKTSCMYDLPSFSSVRTGVCTYVPNLPTPSQFTATQVSLTIPPLPSTATLLLVRPIAGPRTLRVRLTMIVSRYRQLHTEHIAFVEIDIGANTF